MPDEHVDKSIFGWGIATITLGILGIFSAIAVPVFMPTELTLYAIEAYNTVIVPAESAEALKASYEAAVAAKNAGDAAAVAAMQSAQDSKTIRFGFFAHSIIPRPSKAPFAPSNAISDAIKRTTGITAQHPLTRRSLERRSLAKRDLPPSVFSYVSPQSPPTPTPNSQAA